MKNRDIAMARRVAEEVDRAGGRTFYVGGYVRDRLLGKDNKDVDIEIHGIPVRALEEILDGLGERTAMGASFGVMGLRHYGLDIDMPRSERATGRGHRDFEVFVDPFIGAERAAIRRDFTMNALMEDVLTGEILDFFGGREDMEAGLIRHVNDATFAEDPLRVFRAAQFAARFGFDVAEETVALAAAMPVDALAPERVMGELEKALAKSVRPSVFFEQLRRMGQLETWLTELAALSESDWRDAMETLDAAAALRGEAQYPPYFLLAALCAIFERPEGSRFLARLTNEVEATRYAMNLPEGLRRLDKLLEGGSGDDAWMTLFDASSCPKDLILLARAARARKDADWPETEIKTRERLELYCTRMNQPYVMGRDLIAAGVAPGPEMGEALKYAHGLRLSGVGKTEQLELVLRWLDARKEIGGDRT